MNLIDLVSILTGNSHNVDSIVSSITKMIQRLEAAGKYHRQKAVEHLTVADTYSAMADAAGDEAYRAERLKAKIAELMA